MSRRCKSSIWAQFNDNFWKNTFLLNLPPLTKSWSVTRFAMGSTSISGMILSKKMRFSWLEWTTNMLLTERTVRARDWTPATDLVQIINAIRFFACDFLKRSPLSHHPKMRRHQINLTSLVVARRGNYHSWCIMWRSDKRHYATVCFGIRPWGSVFVSMIWLTSSMFNGKVKGHFFSGRMMDLHTTWNWYVLLLTNCTARKFTAY